MIENGASAYSILVATNASDEIEFAAGELQALIEEASGVTLPIVRDGDVAEYTTSSKVISLGETSYATAVGIAAPASLSNYGYVMKTIDQSIFIQAKKDIGVTFGAYGLLEKEFHFECYTDVLYTIDKTSNTRFTHYDIVCENDLGTLDSGSPYADGVIDGVLEYPIYHINTPQKVGKLMRRMGYMDRVEISAGHASVHNALIDVKFSQYVGTYHTDDGKYYDANGAEITNPRLKWFYTDMDMRGITYATTAYQLCYTAHGVKDERDALIDAAAEKVVSYLDREPNEDIVHFSPADKKYWCNCTGCSLVHSQYGTTTAVQILFINDLAERVAELRPNREFKILYLASYSGWRGAPVRYDEGSQKWIAIDEAVQPAENTLPVVSYGSLNFHLDIDDPANATYKQEFVQWMDLTAETGMGVYTYFTNWINYWLYHDHYAGMQSFYRLLAQGNIQWFYEEGQLDKNNGQDGGTAWTALRSYLSSKLARDASQDIDELTVKFFKAYYGEAWEDMLAVFNATRTFTQGFNSAITGLSGEDEESTLHSLKVDLEAVGSDGKPLYWTYEFAKTALDAVNAALAKVDDAQYVANIRAERISYAYLVAELFADEYVADGGDLTALRQQVKEDAELNGIVRICHNVRNPKYATTGLVTDLWAHWGLTA